MSNRGGSVDQTNQLNTTTNDSGSSTRRRRHYQKSRHNPLMGCKTNQTGSLDAKMRQRWRSEGEILLKRGADDEADDDDDEELMKKNHSTYSVPTTTNHHLNHGMQYKKRLLMKYHREQQAEKNFNKKQPSFSFEREVTSSIDIIDVI